MTGELSSERILEPNEVMLRQAKIPRRYWECRFKHLEEGVQKTFIKPFRDIHKMVASGSGLFITGPYGSGKTAMACILCFEAMKRGGIVTFIRMSELMDLVIDKKASIRERIKKSHITVLDDLGGETFGNNANGLRAIEAVMRIPYDEKRSIIITSNLTKDDAKVRYSDGISTMIDRCTKMLTLVSDKWVSK